MSWHLPTGRRSPGSPRRSRAVVMGALLAFATLTTSIELHPHREVLRAGLPHHALSGGTVHAAARHPGATPHLEAAGVGRTLRCPVCLLHLQTAGEAAGDGVAGFRPSFDGRLTAAVQVLPRAATRLPGGSRAPPASR